MPTPRIRPLLLVLLPALAAPAQQTPLVMTPATRPAPPFTLGPKTTIVTEPLHADGTVDYLGAWNHRHAAGVTPDTNGFTRWLAIVPANQLEGERQAIARMAGGQSSANPWLDYETSLTRQGLTDDAAAREYQKRQPAHLHLWNPGDLPHLVDFLEQSADALTLAQAAADAPRWWTPLYSKEGRLVTAAAPILATMRDVAPTLCARATRRAAANDLPGALRDLLTVKCLARHIANESIFSALTAVALDMQAEQTLGAIAGSGILTADQCAQFQKTLDALPPIDAAATIADENERWRLLEEVQIVATGHAATLAQLSDTFDIFRTIDPATADWDTVLIGINHTFDEEVATLRQGAAGEKALAALAQRIAVAWPPKNMDLLPPELLLAKQKTESPAAHAARIQTAFESTATSSLVILNRLELSQRAARLNHDLARTLLAAAAHKATTGKWPDTLDRLLPTELHAIPTDFQNHPPRYALTKAGATLTVVADHNRTLTLGPQEP